MNCSVCDGPLSKGWKYCPDCGYDVRLSEPDELVDHSQECFEPPAGIRGTVLEVVVRQALSGAAWRDVCAGAMKYNNITHAEVEAEVARRRGALPGQEVHASNPSSQPTQEKVDHSAARKPGNPRHHKPTSRRVPPLSTPIQRLAGVKDFLQKLTTSADATSPDFQVGVEKALKDLDRVMSAVQSQESLLEDVEREAKLQRDLDRELRRTSNPLGPEDPGRHYFT